MVKVNLLIVKNIVLVFCLLVTTFSYSEEKCFNLFDGSMISIGIDVEDIKDDKVISESFNKYLVATKSNKKKNIILNMSPFDGSRASIIKELENDPSKYSNYRAIDKAVLGKEVISWGRYKFFFVDYSYGGKNASLGESLYCTSNNCLISNIFEDERRDENISLVSRIMYEFKNKGIEPIRCEDIKLNPHFQVEIYPSASFNKIKPVNIYINKAIEFKGMLARQELRQFFENKNKDCFSVLEEGGDLLDTNELILEDVTKVFENCTIHTDTNSLIPMSFLEGSKVVTRYLTPYSFISRLRSVKQVESRMKLMEVKGRNVLVLKLKNGKKDALLTLPYKKDSNNHLMFDWSFYSSLTGELLTNPRVLLSLKILWEMD